MKKYKDMIYSVRQNGILYVQVWDKGKRHVLYSTNVQELYYKYIEFLTLKNSGKTFNNTLNMEVWANQWLKVYKTDKEKATYQMYADAITNYIIPELR